MGSFDNVNIGSSLSRELIYFVNIGFVIIVLYVYVSEAAPIICNYGGQINVADIGRQER